jgi:hypothetical protein
MLFWDNFDELNDAIFYASDYKKHWSVSENTKWLQNGTSDVIDWIRKVKLC